MAISSSQITGNRQTAYASLWIPIDPLPWFEILVHLCDCPMRVESATASGGVSAEGPNEIEAVSSLLR